MTQRPKLLFLITEDWYFWMHWLGLAKAAREAGYDVIIATRIQEYGSRIAQEGFKVVSIRLSRRSINPFRELLFVRELIRIYRTETPALTYHVAIKPIIYGSICARLAGVSRVVNVFVGLGYTFTGTNLKARLFRFITGNLLKATLRGVPSVVICQNEEDLCHLAKENIVDKARARVIPGMGVDTTIFRPTSEVRDEPIVLLASRMLWDKGIKEFVEAAVLVKRRGTVARFVLAGRCDDENPACITKEQLQHWHDNKDVEWWGHREDMPKVLRQARIVVLPSYREGLPVSLLEAAASGKAIVATDVPGCREVVRHGVNGLLVPPKDVGALAEAIEHLLKNEALRSEFGRRGREMIEKEFSADVAVRKTLDLYREMLHGSDWT